MSNPPSQVTGGQVVSIHFTLTLDDGEVADSTRGNDPMSYLHGHGNIPPGLEEGLEGKSVGDSLDVKVPAAKGFGERDPRGVQEIPRSDFPDDVEFELGMQFGFEGEDGNVAPGWVTAFDDAKVTVDLNHPLAGRELTFAVEVMEVRSPTKEELEHGHAHGAGGHEH